MSTTYTFDGAENRAGDNLPSIKENLYSAVQRLETGFRRITLTPGTETDNVIVVAGQVTDAYGTAIAEACEVVVRSLAVTAGKGDIIVVTGTERVTENPAAGENVSWLVTTAAGAFSFSVTNSAAEVNLVSASTNEGYVTSKKLTFGA